MKKVLLFVGILSLLVSCSKGSLAEQITEEKKEEAAVAGVEPGDIELVFALDKSKTVKDAIDIVKQTKGSKVVNGKRLKIETVNILAYDEQKGSLKLLVKGYVDDVTFNKEMELSGFKISIVALSDY